MPHVLVCAPALGVLALVSPVAQEPEWNPSAITECDRGCLVQNMDRYMEALFKRDPNAVPPLAKKVRMTENTGVVEVGEGVLWRSPTTPTGFRIYVADPVTGQVALQIVPSA